MTFSDDLRDMDFFSCKTEPDIWMRKSVELWEYAAVYVDRLVFVGRDPVKFAKEFEDNYNYKLKATGGISFHLGCDLFRDEDGTLCIEPKKYIEKMIDGYKNMFDENPLSNFKSTIEKRRSSGT